MVTAVTPSRVAAQAVVRQQMQAPVVGQLVTAGLDMDVVSKQAVRHWTLNAAAMEDTVQIRSCVSESWRPARLVAAPISAARSTSPTVRL